MRADHMRRIILICLISGLIGLLMVIPISIIIGDLNHTQTALDCKYDKGTLANETLGQRLLEMQLIDLKNNISKLESNSSFSLEDKILFVRRYVFESVHFIDGQNYNTSKCYRQLMTIESPIWGYSHSCLRREYGPTPNFTVVNKCGGCGEYANLNKYFLEALSIRARVVGVPSGVHAWNEVYINDTWIPVDASISDFSFDEPYAYTNFFVRVEEGEGEGMDITKKYNVDPSIGENILRLIYKLRLKITTAYKQSNAVKL